MSSFIDLQINPSSKLTISPTSVSKVYYMSKRGYSAKKVKVAERDFVRHLGLIIIR